MSSFYDGNKLLSLRTLSGGNPEIFFLCGNRTAGKSFWFKRWMLRRYINKNEKFVIFVRDINDIKGRSESFFADIGPLFFQKMRMRQRKILEGKAAVLQIQRNENAKFEDCGYVISLKFVRPIKENSALFSDAIMGFFDEFQDEDGRYLKDEIEKFNSVRISIARGGKEGKHTRYFPVYLVSNNVTIFNPYFDYFRIASRLEEKARYIRGDCWVLEQCFNSSASSAILEQFAGMSEREKQYAAGKKYLLDTHDFIAEMPGQKYPIFTFSHCGNLFTLWNAVDFYYVSDKIADGLPAVITFTNDDHREGDIMVGKNGKIVKSIRDLYMHDMIRFRNGKCKKAFLDICTIK